MAGVTYPGPWVAERHRDGTAYGWMRLVGISRWECAYRDDKTRLWTPSVIPPGGRTVRGQPVGTAEEAKKAAAALWVLA